MQNAFRSHTFLGFCLQARLSHWGPAEVFILSEGKEKKKTVHQGLSRA